MKSIKIVIYASIILSGRKMLELCIVRAIPMLEIYHAKEASLNLSFRLLHFKIFVGDPKKYLYIPNQNTIIMGYRDVLLSRNGVHII